MYIPIITKVLYLKSVKTHIIISKYFVVVLLENRNTYRYVWVNSRYTNM